MKRGKERAGQYDFLVSGVPETIKTIIELPDGPEINKILSRRKIWSPKGVCIFCDLRSGTELLFKADTWQTGELKTKLLNGALLIGSPLSGENFETVGVKIGELCSKLSKGSPIVFFEEKGGSVLDEIKPQLLSDAGLVARNLATRLSANFNVLEGREEKKRPPAKAKDMLDGVKYPKARAEAERLWVAMERRYKRNGWNIVNREESPIIARLHSCKNPPKVFGWLKDGLGVTIENVHCGCKINKRFDGEDEEVWNCGQGHSFATKKDRDNDSR